MAEAKMRLQNIKFNKENSRPQWKQTFDPAT